MYTLLSSHTLGTSVYIKFIIISINGSNLCGPLMTWEYHTNVFINLQGPAKCNQSYQL